MGLRSFGFGLIGIFVPVFLFHAGVSLQNIFMFLAAIFIFRIPLAFAFGLVVGRIGPKHSIAVSTIIFIAFLFLLLSFESIGWPLLFLSFTFTFANGLFFIAYNTDFSKIQHNKHGGKELGWLYIFESFGSALGPIVGGLTATFFAPELTIVLSIVVLLVSLVPLFMTNEPVKVHQKISYRKFTLKPHMRGYIALGASAIQKVTNLALWPLLVAVLIFTDETYAKLGLLVAASVLVSMFAARMFGKFIDNKKGKALLRYGVGMNFVLQLSKAIVTSAGGAFGVSALGEPVLLSCRMPIINSYYDAAGSVEDFRIVYIVWGEVWSSISKGAFFVGLFLFSYFYDPISVMRVSFVIIPFIGLLMLMQRIPIIKKV